MTTLFAFLWICLFPTSGSCAQQKSISFGRPTISEHPNRETQELVKLQETQQVLEKRYAMLKMHKHLGYLTFALMTASILTPKANVNIHKVLGIATAASYAATAYHSIFAPTPDGFEPSDRNIWHRTLAWVHGSGMLLTPILGIVRYNQKQKGQAAVGLGKLHAPVALGTYLVFGAALTIATF